MVIYNERMTITVTELKARCLQVIRDMERDGHPVDIVRHGKVVARIFPAGEAQSLGQPPWKRLHGSGELLADAGESVLTDSDFEALRR
jgi:antitoxin (DNA-binding transcriptional repressor) of toxin-antitoxin stability system